MGEKMTKILQKQEVKTGLDAYI
ncbi:MAG: hypothetical protein YK1312THETA_2100008 [Marine Group I thaumarchaeote]|nr:MAG: hypothetical protein YK1312THETA_2100008 [Marine Group I thaumarchaeote]